MTPLQQLRPSKRLDRASTESATWAVDRDPSKIPDHQNDSTERVLKGRLPMLFSFGFLTTIKTTRQSEY